MKWIIGVTALSAGMLVMSGASLAQSEPPVQAPNSPNYPAWAYAIPAPPPPGSQPPGGEEDGGTLLTLPGSTLSFTASKVRGRREDGSNERVAPADWFPEDHPSMPRIVAEGDNSRGIVACSLCHLPNGKGRPENAPVAGQSPEYIIMTLMDMKNGLRSSADPRKNNANTMNNFAKAMTRQEIEAAAGYFSSMKWTPWIKVRETARVPRMYSRGGMWLPVEGAGAGTEPIGMRVLETPENVEYAERMRSPRSGFIAYAPAGSVAKGKSTVTTGDNGKTLACSICHGPDLHGVGSIPGIAARSPSYIARQLFNYQAGTRAGAMAALMKPVVARLTNEDFVNITAYLAGLPAQVQTPTFSPGPAAAEAGVDGPGYDYVDANALKCPSSWDETAMRFRNENYWIFQKIAGEKDISMVLRPNRDTGTWDRDVDARDNPMTITPDYYEWESVIFTGINTVDRKNLTLERARTDNRSAASRCELVSPEAARTAVAARYQRSLEGNRL